MYFQLKTTVHHQIWGNTPIGRHKMMDQFSHTRNGKHGQELSGNGQELSENGQELSGNGQKLSGSNEEIVQYGEEMVQGGQEVASK